jgi:hypothetical protein
MGHPRVVWGPRQALGSTAAFESKGHVVIGMCHRKYPTPAHRSCIRSCHPIRAFLQRNHDVNHRKIAGRGIVRVSKRVPQGDLVECDSPHGCGAHAGAVETAPPRSAAPGSCPGLRFGRSEFAASSQKRTDSAEAISTSSAMGISRPPAPSSCATSWNSVS